MNGRNSFLKYKRVRLHHFDSSFEINGRGGLIVSPKSTLLLMRGRILSASSTENIYLLKRTKVEIEQTLGSNQTSLNDYLYKYNLLLRNYDFIFAFVSDVFEIKKKGRRDFRAMKWVT